VRQIFAASFGEVFGIIVRVVIMCMMDEMRANRDELYAIAGKHKAERLWAFGSRARREAAAI